MAKNYEKCNGEEDKYLCETNEPEEFIINKGEDYNPDENGRTFISLCSFPKAAPPEIILGIEHSEFTKEQIENLFGVRG